MKANIDLPALGLSTIACKSDKSPRSPWKQAQTEILPCPESSHYGIVCGAVSGNLECIDYDRRHDPTDGKMWHQFVDIIHSYDEELLPKLLLERSINNGIHIIYRCEEPVGAGVVLAKNTDGAAFYETRGEGQYFLCAESEGYQYMQGEYPAMPVITALQRKLLHDAARSLTLYDVEDPRSKSNDYRRDNEVPDGSPLNWYDEHGDVLALLTKYRWQITHERSIPDDQGTRMVTYLRRPGKAEGSLSATFNYIPRRLHVFTTADEALPAGHYRPSAVYAFLTYGHVPGAFSKTARDIARMMMAHEDPPPSLPAKSTATGPADVTHDYVLACLGNNERGDAQLFSMVKKDKLIFDHSLQEWFYFATDACVHWRRDVVATINTDCADTLAHHYSQAAAQEKIVHDKAAESFAIQAQGDRNTATATRVQADEASKKMARLTARVHMLRTWKRTPSILKFAVNLLGIDGTQWDANPNVLGVANGVVDLQTGAFRAVAPNDYIRSFSPVAYHHDAQCPQFINFLNTIFSGDTTVVAFMQRLLGYGITGLTTEHVYPILWGETGFNGKDTLVHIIQSVLGTSLAKSIHPDVLIDHKGNNGGASEELYDLWGLRIGWLNETEETSRLKESTLKIISGGSLIKCHPKYGHMVEFKPTHLLFLITNHKPSLSALDDALWSRIILIPFNERFVDNPKKTNEHRVDKDILAKMKAEASGILRWLIEGSLAWRRTGLNVPAVLTAQTSTYRDEQADTTAQWLSTCCTLAPSAFIEGGKAYTHYATWCKEQGFYALGRKGFTQRLLKVEGVTSFNCMHGLRGRGFDGVDVDTPFMGHFDSQF